MEAKARAEEGKEAHTGESPGRAHLEGQCTQDISRADTCSGQSVQGWREMQFRRTGLRVIPAAAQGGNGGGGGLGGGLGGGGDCWGGLSQRELRRAARSVVNHALLIMKVQ